MSKHTQSPWQVLNTADIYTGLGSPRADGTTAPSDDGWMIADCDMGGLPLGEVAANARLIASAPELLSLLKEARSTLEMWKDVAPAVSLCADIDRAIAKATGDQP